MLYNEIIFCSVKLTFCWNKNFLLPWKICYLGKTVGDYTWYVYYSYIVTHIKAAFCGLQVIAVHLQVDVELAKSEANKPEDDVELKKKLWLRIGKDITRKYSFFSQWPWCRIKTSLSKIIAALIIQTLT